MRLVRGDVSSDTLLGSKIVYTPFSHADSLNRIIIPVKMRFESVLEQQRHSIRVRHICSTARNQ